jgi:hypothetical protein
MNYVQMKKLLIASLIFTGCSVTRPSIESLTITSTKKVDKGTVVTFQEKKGRFFLPSDTLKVNDVITMNYVHKL